MIPSTLFYYVDMISKLQISVKSNSPSMLYFIEILHIFQQVGIVNGSITITNISVE